MKRRSFIKYTSLAAAGSVVGLTPFGRMAALAEASDYKALLCIFLGGGNDSNNMIVPTDGTNYSLYQQGRGGLSIPHDQLLSLKGIPFGFHPSMPELQGLFNASTLAVVANLGSLVQPTTMSQFKAGTVKLPHSLMSHNDQAILWEAATAGSEGVSTGWGGAIADRMESRFDSGQLPMAISVAGLRMFTSGVSTSAFVSPGRDAQVFCAERQFCDARIKATQQLLQLESGATLVQADNQRTSKMYTYLDIFGNALRQVPQLQTKFPDSDFGNQLRDVTQVIQARSILGARRQIFFAQLQTFDTHSNQLGSHADSLRQLSAAIGAFSQAMKEINADKEVTTFTMSEFSRALQGNISSGSDHAWGSHHLVMGGAVKGGSIFGTFPNLQLGGPDDIDGAGRWLPTSSVAQYGAGLASWFGVPAEDLNGIFPVLSNFKDNNIGFI